jgi:hypothetical protein
VPEIPDIYSPIPDLNHHLTVVLNKLPSRRGFSQTPVSLSEALSAFHTKFANLLGPLIFPHTLQHMLRLSPDTGASYLFRNQMNLFPAADDLLWSITFSLVAVTLWGAGCSTLLRRVVLKLDKGTLIHTVCMLGMDLGYRRRLS